MSSLKRLIHILILLSIINLLSCAHKGKTIVNDSPVIIEWEFPSYELKLELQYSTVLFFENSPVYELYTETGNVSRWKDYYLNNDAGRELIMLLMEKQYIIAKLKRIFREHGLPEELSFISFVESTFRNNARSRMGALGLWQFMHHTGRNNGLRVNWWVDERLNPDRSTSAAITYLKKLYEMFGDWQIALLAYNYGENGVKRILERYGLDGYERMPRETRNYLPKIKALIQIFAGYRFVEIEEEGFFEHTLTGFWDLADIAKQLGACEKKLRSLNPEYVNGYSIKGRNTFRFPTEFKDSIVDLKRSKHSTDDVIVVTVKKGDTIYGISKRFNIPYTRLLQINNISNPHRIKPGQKIYVPVRSLR